MRNTLTLILFLFVYNSCLAQELKKEYQDVVLTFINYIKDNNTEKLKTLTSYPLKRAYPLSSIHDEIEFIKRYNEVFDDSLKSKIIESNLKKDWSSVGWRGIMLNNGTLWLDYDGKLLAVNYQSNFEQIKKAKLIETPGLSIQK